VSDSAVASFNRDRSDEELGRARRKTAADQLRIFDELDDTSVMRSAYGRDYTSPITAGRSLRSSDDPLHA